MMAAGTQQATGGTTATIPNLNPTQARELQQRWLASNDGDEDTRVANRFLCVMLACKTRWTPEVLAEFLGIPEIAVNHYIQAYNTSGIEGLGKEPPGGEGFYQSPSGSQARR
jgi:hypothetical protein